MHIKIDTIETMINDQDNSQSPPNIPTNTPPLLFASVGINRITKNKNNNSENQV